MARVARILQVKVTLRGARPPIWRRLLVETETDLASFHHVLQRVMGWYDCHLHQFEANGVVYAPPESELDLPTRNEAKVTVGPVLKSVKDRLRYEYDFGDGWSHEIVVEKVVPREEGQLYPWVLAGKGACPPEDCGGVYGYAELLEVLADPAHPRYEELLDWAGDDFDPAAFDLQMVNARLHPPKRPRVKRSR